MNIPSHYSFHNSFHFIKETLFSSSNFQNKKIEWVVLAIFSCLALAYSLYYCIKQYSITELSDLQDSFALSGEAGLSQINDNNQNDLLKTESLQQILLDQVKSCQATRNLYQLAKRTIKDLTGFSLKIKILPLGDPILKGMQGLCCWHTGEILICSDVSPDRAFSILIFELANATQAVEFKKLYEAYTKQTLSKEEFALAMEQIEYASVLLHTTTMKDAIVEKGAAWQKYDEYHTAALNEIAHYDNQIASGHTAYYLNN